MLTFYLHLIHGRSRHHQGILHYRIIPSALVVSNRQVFLLRVFNFTRFSLWAQLFFLPNDSLLGEVHLTHLRQSSSYGKVVKVRTIEFIKT